MIHAATRLFAGDVPVRCQQSQLTHLSGALQASASASYTTLHLEIRMTPNLSHSVQRGLCMKITDERDMMILHVLDISEERFQVVKSEQQLLVDFPGFSAKFIELVQLCIQSHSNHTHKFVASLDHQPDGTMLFVVTETNPFRHITHLKLNFLQASDAVLKEHLAQCLMNTKEILLETQSKLEVTRKAAEERLMNQDETVRTLQSRDNETAQRFAQERESHAKQCRMIEEEKNRILDAATQERVSEVLAIKTRHQTQLSQLENQLASLELKSSQERSKFQECEKQKQKLQDDLQGCVRQLELRDTELSHAQNRAKQLEADLSSNQGGSQRLHKELADMGQTLRARESDLAQAQHQARQIEASHMETKSKLEQSKADKSKLEEELQSSNAELNKSKDLLTQISSELRSVKTKLKAKTTLVEQSDKDRAESDKSRRMLCDELEHANRELKETRKRFEETSARLAEVKEDLDARVNKNESDRQVIEWLNKEINEARQGRSVYHQFQSGARRGFAVDCQGLEGNKVGKPAPKTGHKVVFNPPLL